MTCWERQHGRILHSFRSDLGKKIQVGVVSGIEATKNCPNCSSHNIEKKGKRKVNQRYVCNNCRKNWSVHIKSSSIKYAFDAENFERETPLNEIRNYLKNCEQNGSGISFYYKNKPVPTSFSRFRVVSDDLIQCFYSRGDKRSVHTYRIDRIRRI